MGSVGNSFCLERNPSLIEASDTPSSQQQQLKRDHRNQVWNSGPAEVYSKVYADFSEGKISL